jgi:hypothetical protein
LMIVLIAETIELITIELWLANLSSVNNLVLNIVCFYF